MKRVHPIAFALLLLLSGCTPGALVGLQTAQTVVDTPAPVTVATPDDAVAGQREIADLQRQLAEQQAELSAILAEMARRAAASSNGGAP